MTTDWREVNRNANCSLPLRLLRACLALVQQRRNAVLDFEGKLRFFSRLDLPRNPSVVHFGAEVGREAAMLQALFGDEGRLLLIDSDPVAYERFERAPLSVRGESANAQGKQAEVD